MRRRARFFRPLWGPALRVVAVLVLILSSLPFPALAPNLAQAVPLGAPTSAEVRIEPTLRRLPVGGEAAVSLVAGLQPGQQLGAWTVDLAFDPAVVDAVSCTASVLGATAVCNVEFAADKVRVTGVHPEGLGATVTLASLNFRALGAAGATSALTPTVVTFADSDGAALPTATTPGSLVIGSRCDVDADGDIDAVDALKVLRLVAGLDAGTGDVDEDGDTDAVDALRILRFVAGLQSECGGTAPPPDTTPPDTTMTSTPSSTTTSTSASFSFTGTEAGSTFACQLDGGTFSPCTSPTEYTGLAVGSHTFAVQATDPAGNTDSTPATYTWTIDTATGTGLPPDPSTVAPALDLTVATDIATATEFLYAGGSGSPRGGPSRCACTTSRTRRWAR